MPDEAYQQYLAQLAEKRRPAVAQAEQLLADDRFDEAERVIAAVDDSIYGRVATARLFREALARLVEQRDPPCDRARLEACFERAEQLFHSCYPDPHTLIEAEDFERGREDDTAELVKILGYNPKGD